MIYALLPLVLMVICVVHAVKTNRIFPWIYVIVFLPFVGSLIYAAMAILPDLFRSRAAGDVRSAAARAIDPNKEFRQAMREAEMVGSVDSKRMLAEQFVQRERYAEAVELYRSALQGHFRDDPVLWLGLARAQFLLGDSAGVCASIGELWQRDQKFKPDETHMLHARALELQGEDEKALAEYAELVRHFAGEEARCRYASLLARLGRHEEATSIYRQILKSLEGAPRHYRKTQKQWADAASQALKSQPGQ